MATEVHCNGAKVKSRDGKRQISKIKRLKKRLSASFGRLSLSKEDTIHESDQESEATKNGDDSTYNAAPPNLALSRCGLKDDYGLITNGLTPANL